MRKREVVRVPEGYGRDSTPVRKTFLITEWDAARAEEWAMRALIAYNRGGGQVPEAALQSGMEGIFWLGVNTFLRGQMQAAEIIPILQELMECVKIVRDPSKPGMDGQPIATDIIPEADDIEEIKTRLWLRSEVLRVHTNFSVADLVSRLISEIAARAASSKLQTSPDQSP